MKFAKELEEDLVPEWRVKYFNYKIGKKKVKAASRALRNAVRTPQSAARPQVASTQSADRLPFTSYDFVGPKQSPQITERQSKDGPQAHAAVVPAETSQRTPRPSDNFDRRASVTVISHTPPGALGPDNSQDDLPLVGEDQNEEQDDDSDGSSDSDNEAPQERTPLKSGSNGTAFPARPRYGSIIGSPPDHHHQDHHHDRHHLPEEDSLPALHLPDPVLDPSKKKPSTLRVTTSAGNSPRGNDVLSPKFSKPTRTPTDAPTYWEQQKARRASLRGNLFRKHFQDKDESFRSKLKLNRAFTHLHPNSPNSSNAQLESFRELDARQEEFFSFLDRELNKIETFYKEKEDEAGLRLRLLREQLHEMRDRRLQDLKLAQRGGKVADGGLLDGQIPIMSTLISSNGLSEVSRTNLFDPIHNIFNSTGKIGKTSHAREELASPRGSIMKSNKNDRGDYVRRQQPHEKVPYRFAKRKLKLALQEFYRGLELLKSYALLNRTAFRKINKKYDKAVNARPPLRYMAEKVNNAHFVQSTFIEETLVSIEDLYARYFERGNRKVAVNKLRSHHRQGEHSSVSFRNGLYIAAGLGFAVSGIFDGLPFITSDEPVLKTQSNYLLQIYAGYLMAVLLFLFFVVNCRVWTRAKVNYIFVFEYDTRNTLNWRQLAEMPCFFLFLNGLFVWLNFQFHAEHHMYIYWPVILIGVTAIIIFLPFKVLYYDARKWFAYSNWRLLLAGLYPVEFRDFYLGDMYCSETYSMSQMEVFFCLYAHHWRDPPQCNSNHSRLLGFFTTLPAIWRALQCLRRYYDSRNWFPHLANFSKYCCNILYYMSLSLYRIELSGQKKAIFIVFALINGLYCSFWDVFMDFSLGNPWSKNFLLRDHLAFRKKWPYYFVMVVDVILRQQWIFYAIFTEDAQHSSIVSFLVALAEVIRRGLWSIFRVENEHCNNVIQFRASRDIPLPYSVPDSPLDGKRRSLASQTSHVNGKATGPKGADKNRADDTDLEQATPRTSTSSRRGASNASTPAFRKLQRVGSAIAAAHAQDFQKKRRPETLGRTVEDERMMHRTWSDDDDELDDAEEIAATRQASEHQQLPVDGGDISPRQQPTQTAGTFGAGGLGAASGSGSGSDGHGRSPSARAERDHLAMRQADEADQIEVEEARDHVESADR